jgi:hypothetical protein
LNRTIRWLRPLAVCAAAALGPSSVAAFPVAAAAAGAQTAPPAPSSPSVGESSTRAPVILLAGDTPTVTRVPPPAPAPQADSGGQANAAAATASMPVSFAAGFPTNAKAAVQAAADIWAGLISSSQPITVSASYSNLGSGILASAGPSQLWRDFPGETHANTWYAGPLAEALSGQNLGGSVVDIAISINQRSDWYFGTDGNPSTSQFDLMMIVLHEIIHGLGFLGTMDVSGGLGRCCSQGPPPDMPDIYDRFTEDAAGQSLLSYPNGSVQLANALQSNGVYFDSPLTNTASSDRPKLYAPSPWNAGSSIAHLDEATYPPGSSGSLITPYINRGEAVHAPGHMVLCMLEALGWTTSEACPSTANSVVSGATFYADGKLAKSGPSGSTVTAFAVGAIPGVSYVLVSGKPSGSKACALNVVAINPAIRFSTDDKFIGNTKGIINRPAGDWQVCFRSPDGATYTAPLTFTVT